jgi:hypothetical protein
MHSTANEPIITSIFDSRAKLIDAANKYRGSKKDNMSEQLVKGAFNNFQRKISNSGANTTGLLPILALQDFDEKWFLYQAKDAYFLIPHSYIRTKLNLPKTMTKEKLQEQIIMLGFKTINLTLTALSKLVTENKRKDSCSKK